MRLTPEDTQILINIFSKWTRLIIELRLFGSRLDDEKKGGDIDLLLIAISEEARKQLVFNKSDILADIKTELGDQKVDLIITTLSGIENDPFLTIIYPDSQCIKSWS